MKQRPTSVPKHVAESADYEKARSCVFCNDTCDSFGRYVSTYCHKFHEHLAGFGDGNVSRCRDCASYKPRPERKGADNG